MGQKSSSLDGNVQCDEIIIGPQYEFKSRTSLRGIERTENCCVLCYHGSSRLRPVPIVSPALRIRVRARLPSAFQAPTRHGL